MKKSMLIMLALATFLSGISTAAYAIGSQPYINLQFGYGERDTGNISGLQQNTRSGFAYRIAVGYLFASSPYFRFGPEVGYLGVPDNQYSDNVNYDGEAADLLLNIVFQNETPWYLMFKGGVAYVTQRLTDTAGSRSTERRILPEAAVAIGYRISKHFSLAISANRIFGRNGLDGNSSNLNNGVASITTYMGELTFAF